MTQNPTFQVELPDQGNDRHYIFRSFMPPDRDAVEFVFIRYDKTGIDDDGQDQWQGYWLDMEGPRWVPFQPYERMHHPSLSIPRMAIPQETTMDKVAAIMRVVVKTHGGTITREDLG